MKLLSFLLACGIAFGNEKRRNETFLVRILLPYGNCDLRSFIQSPVLSGRNAQAKVVVMCYSRQSVLFVSVLFGPHARVQM